jgi:D-lactate dehydrogenase
VSARLTPLRLAGLQRAVADPERVLTSALSRHAYASDASHFALLPQAVVVAASASEVAALVRSCTENGLAATFRSGGTSLSGQAVTEGVLIDTRRHFKQVEVLEGGRRVRVQPGVTVRQLNAALAPYGTRFGPDPASEAACTVGGVIANNSSGMSCGTEWNAYRTLESATVVLPHGMIVDTAAPDADARLRHVAPEIYQGLLQHRDALRSDPSSSAEIARQFRIKNTMGYALNAFLDHDRPSDILAHLLVGSEGTLGFVAEAVFRTLPVLGHATTGLFVVESLRAATSWLPNLAETGPVAIELMDASSLRVAQQGDGVLPQLKGLSVGKHAALLVEYQAASAENLAELVDGAGTVLQGLGDGMMITDEGQRAAMWKLRKGLYASVAGARRPGTTAILEDVAVPVPSLAELCEELSRLLVVNSYHQSVIFGHAKDGNVHFMLTDRFESRADLARLDRFTESLVDLVLELGGTLKAEHGTGRMMAPFVRRQYGDLLYGVMQDVRRIFDPTGTLNPGVLLNDDPTVHLQYLKTYPTVEPEVDRCVECGYCEPVCPSRDLTTTPRQRIVLRRAVASALERGDEALAAEIEADYGYAAIETCAVDGMCETACPVLINTGDLVKRLRSEAVGRAANRAAEVAAGHWGASTRLAALGLDAAHHLPTSARRTTAVARAVTGSKNIPAWTEDLPRGGRRRGINNAPSAAQVIFFPSCVNSVFGTHEGPGVQQAFQDLCGAVGISVRIPRHVDKLCCSVPWSSKGLTAGHARMTDLVTAQLALEAPNPAVPVVVDAVSCTEGLARMLPQPGTQVLDATTYVTRFVLPSLGPVRRLKRVVLHPTCSSTRSGINADLIAIAEFLAEDVVVPRSWGCCGFAGDRGLLVPELTAAATTAQAEEIRDIQADAFVSCNRPCEIALSRATGRTYRHILEVLADAYHSAHGGWGPSSRST